MRVFGSLVAAVILITVVGAQAAVACTIDGIASMKINHFWAVTNRTVPTAATLAHWAPFSLGEAAPNNPVVLQEIPGKLRNVLPREAFLQPFSWQLGDGANARGASLTHTYAHTGWYRVQVSYYWPSQHRWVQFDSAQLHVVPPVTVSAVAAQSTGAGTDDKKMLVIGISGVVGLGCIVLLAQVIRMARREEASDGAD